MEKKSPTVLLLEDELTEYNNWKKWINYTNNKTKLIYVSDIDSAIEETNKNSIDIYIIDLHLSEGNILNFLKYIKNRKGLKFALSGSIDNLEYLEKLYELGAIPISIKSNALADPMRAAELIFSLYDLGLESDEDLLTATEDIKTEILNDVAVKLEQVSSQVNKLKVDFEQISNEIIIMKLYLLGDYQTIGLKGKVEMLEEDVETIKLDKTTLVQQFALEFNRSPIVVKCIILVFAGLMLATLPLILVHKITGS